MDDTNDLDGVLAGTGLAHHGEPIDRVQRSAQARSDDGVVVHDHHPHRFRVGHDVNPVGVSGSSACT